MSAWTDADNDVTNLSGGPDLDTAARDPLDAPDEDDRPQDNPRVADTRSGAPSPTSDPVPTADDPYVLGSPDISDGLEDPGPADVPEEGPTYEQDQGTNEEADGGSTDPHNTMIHGQDRPRLI